MSDIVERLRQEAERAALCVDSGHDGLCAEAADEIERLRVERDRLWDALDGVMNSHGEQLHDAFAVARAALRKSNT